MQIVITPTNNTVLYKTIVTLSKSLKLVVLVTHSCCVCLFLFTCLTGIKLLNIYIICWLRIVNAYNDS